MKRLIFDFDICCYKITNIHSLLQLFDNDEPLGYEKIEEVRTEWAKYFLQRKN